MFNKLILNSVSSLKQLCMPSTMQKNINALNLLT